MKDIAIYGFGGFGREIACVIEAINQESPTWNIVGYFDDGHAVGDANRYGKVIGGINELNAYPRELALVFAIASPSTVKTLYSKISNPNISFPNIIASNVFFFDRSSVVFGMGNVITFNGRISCGVRFGNFNLINGCVSIGHDVTVGDYNMMQPEVRISGETSIGDMNYFGVRSLVLQGLKVGNNIKVGAASVIMRNTKDFMTYFGNPARILEI